MNKKYLNKWLAGFSLLELLIALAILLILTSLAYANYQHHLVAAHRHQAILTVMRLASELESYYTMQHSYQGASVAALGLNALNENIYYQFAITVNNPQTYVITATPTQSQAEADVVCGILSLNELNQQMTTGSGISADCWR